MAGEGQGRGEEPLRGTGAFRSLDVTSVRRALATLHQQVACGRGRVEIRRRGCDDVCVMISKAELEALENALHILSDTSDFRAMSAMLTEIAAAASGVTAPAQA